MRLRQLVIAARDGKAVADDIRHVLGLGDPFPDPGVMAFGLENAVFAIGDQFLEVIWPVKDDAPAERFLQKNGEGGYMVILQTDDLPALRSHADAIGIRRVWNADLEDIAASHFHPADTGGAILSVDTPVPPEGWRWGGPDWPARAVPGKLTGAEFVSTDAPSLRKRWAGLLQLAPDGSALPLEDAVLYMTPSDRDALIAFDVALAGVDAALARAGERGLPVSDNTVTIAGTDLRLHSL